MDMSSLLLSILSNLHVCLSVWTGITFTWGLFIALGLAQINKACIAQNLPKMIDNRCIALVWAANVVSFFALVAIPATMANQVDVAIVANTFLCTTFTAYTYNLVIAWKAKLFATDNPLLKLIT